MEKNLYKTMMEKTKMDSAWLNKMKKWTPKIKDPKIFYQSFIHNTLLLTKHFSDYLRFHLMKLTCNAPPTASWLPLHEHPQHLQLLQSRPRQNWTFCWRKYNLQRMRNHSTVEKNRRLNHQLNSLGTLSLTDLILCNKELRHPENIIFFMFI